MFFPKKKIPSGITKLYDLQFKRYSQSTQIKARNLCLKLGRGERERERVRERKQHDHEAMMSVSDIPAGSAAASLCPERCFVLLCHMLVRRVLLL